MGRNACIGSFGWGQEEGDRENQKSKKKSGSKKASKGGPNFYKRAIKTPVTRKRNIISGKRKTTFDKDSFEKGVVFVAMSFLHNPGMNDVFSAIKDTCRRLKLTPKRVDENVASGFIILEVVNLMERAEFIIFDVKWLSKNGQRKKSVNNVLVSGFSLKPSKNELPYLPEIERSPHRAYSRSPLYPPTLWRQTLGLRLKRIGA